MHLDRLITPANVAAACLARSGRAACAAVAAAGDGSRAVCHENDVAASSGGYSSQSLIEPEPNRARVYSRMTAGSGSCPWVVRATAAARMSVPPTQA